MFDLDQTTVRKSEKTHGRDQGFTDLNLMVRKQDSVWML